MITYHTIYFLEYLSYTIASSYVEKKTLGLKGRQASVAVVKGISFYRKVQKDDEREGDQDVRACHSAEYWDF